VTVVGIVLAAGAGSRFGAPKAEVVVDGERLLDRAVRVLRGGGCVDVIAVVRAGTRVDDAIAVVNIDPDRGLSSSLRLGLAAATDTAAERAVVVLVDMPGVTVDVVAAVAAGPGPVTMADYGAIHGHPIAFERAVWAAVAETAHGDEGARGYLAAHPELVTAVPVAAGPHAPVDIDTPADLAAWRDKT